MPKFKTLEHNGVIFPKKFEAKGRTLNNQTLNSLAEEMLYCFTQRFFDKETLQITATAKIIKNFYKCLKPELTIEQQQLIFPIQFQNLFIQLTQDIQEHKEYMEQTKEERKKKNEQLKEKYGFAIIDGVKEPLGNYAVEPPGIFIGRGNSPLIGLWKYRTEQKDVVLNFVSDKQPPIGDWKIEHNRNVLYIAYYEINVGNITKKRKEIRFGNKSNIIAERDKEKFKKSKKLLLHWDKIQQQILKDLPFKEEALIAWLIQFTSIRIGTEGEENDVVGASTLCVENIKILSSNSFKLKFVGKDSIEFSEVYEDIDEVIVESLEKLMVDKNDGDKIFDVKANDVNEYLNTLLPGLTAKVFRTAWASKLLIEEFKGLRKLTLQQLKEILLKVSKKLNHKKAITESAKNSLDKLKTKISELEEKLTTCSKKQKPKIKEKIKELKEKLKFKKESLDINLNTALTNYINPVLIFDICKKFEIDVSLIYSKSLLERFAWVFSLVF